MLKIYKFILNDNVESIFFSSDLELNKCIGKEVIIKNKNVKFCNDMFKTVVDDSYTATKLLEKLKSTVIDGYNPLDLLYEEYNCSCIDCECLK